jgi:elongation factor 3
MGALSGGQKVKVVLGAGLWNLPHIVILDEPTNFLDRDSLGALACAIKEFKGGLFMISHNAEFYEALCPEKWILESGRLTVMGAEWMEEVEKARKKAEKLAKRTLNLEEAEEKKDALGNTIKLVEEKKELNRADKKLLMKQRKDLIKRGEDTFEIDQLLGLE